MTKYVFVHKLGPGERASRKAHSFGSAFQLTSDCKKIQTTGVREVLFDGIGTGAAFVASHAGPPESGICRIASKGTIRRKVERTMADVTDLAAKIEERRRRIDLVDQALAEMRRAAAAAGTRGRRDRAKKQKRGPRQLRLPLPLSNGGYR